MLRSPYRGYFPRRSIGTNRKMPCPILTLSSSEHLIHRRGIVTNNRSLAASFLERARRQGAEQGGRVGFCHDSAKAFRYELIGVQKGGSIDSRTPVCSCCVSIVADRRRIFRRPLFSRGLAGPRSPRQLRGRGRARGFVLAGRAVEGRAFARRLRRGEAARERAVADRARWKRRGQIA